MSDADRARQVIRSHIISGDEQSASLSSAKHEMCSLSADHSAAISYSLPRPNDTDDIFKVIGSKVKVRHIVNAIAPEPGISAKTYT